MVGFQIPIVLDAESTFCLVLLLFKICFLSQDEYRNKQNDGQSPGFGGGDPLRAVVVSVAGRGADGHHSLEQDHVTLRLT